MTNGFNKSKQIHSTIDTYISNDYTNVLKSIKMTSYSKQYRQKAKKTERQKTLSVDNADLFKPVLNKKIAMHE